MRRPGCDRTPAPSRIRELPPHICPTRAAHCPWRNTARSCEGNPLNLAAPFFPHVQGRPPLCPSNCRGRDPPERSPNSSAPLPIADRALTPALTSRLLARRSHEMGASIVLHVLGIYNHAHRGA